MGKYDKYSTADLDKASKSGFRKIRRTTVKLSGRGKKRKRLLKRY
jgi:hypothetical protein